MALAGPAQAQVYSEGYQFLQAVEEALNGGDASAVTEMLDVPGATVVNARDLSTGRTAMHLVVEKRNGVWLDYLYQQGANVNLADNQGITPLMRAVQLGYLEGASKLIGHGARVDVTNNSGETPLMFAVHGRNAEMMRVLLTAGADPDRNDHSGRSARDYARLRGERDITNDVIARHERPASQRGGGTYGPSF
jgi:ankyrin repeat protein